MEILKTNGYFQIHNGVSVYSIRQIWGRDEMVLLFLNIPRWPKPVPSIYIHYDSQSAIGRAQNNMYNGKSRHIRHRHNIIRQLLLIEVISLDYVKSKDNASDKLTKGLNKELVEKSSKGMRLKPIKE